MEKTKEFLFANRNDKRYLPYCMFNDIIIVMCEENVFDFVDPILTFGFDRGIRRHLLA